jgi:putative molybdopterin biosynthesis protein
MPLRGGASVLTSLVQADALLTIPAERDGLPAAAAVEPELLRAGRDLGGALLLAGAPDLALALLALAIADTGRGTTRVAFCEMAPEDAVALVRDGLCHAAVVAGSGGTSPIERTSGPLISARLAECEVVLAVAADNGCAAPGDLLRPGASVVVGPPGTPARRVLEDALRALGALACEVTGARSDAAALATVAGGYAVCAASTAPAASRAGLDTIPLGRARLDLVIHRAVSKRDPALRSLLDMLRSRSLAATLKQAGYTPGDVLEAAA